jgi:co-chaperonin GroES (HSP10)
MKFDLGSKNSFQPNRVGALQALRDTVLVTDMNFEQRITSSGIILPSDDGKNSGIRPRWAKVYATGPDQKDVQVGQWILISHGRWTRGIDIEDSSGKTSTIRKVDNDDILLISDQPVVDDTMSDKVIE